MVGVKDAHQECLIGQSGEIEPVYERYTVSFFVVAGVGYTCRNGSSPAASPLPCGSNARTGTSQ
jgi:hypothetical protein